MTSHPMVVQDFVIQCFTRFRFWNELSDKTIATLQARGKEQVWQKGG